MITAEYMAGMKKFGLGNNKKFKNLFIYADGFKPTSSRSCSYFMMVNELSSAIDVLTSAASGVDAENFVQTGK